MDSAILAALIGVCGVLAGLAVGAWRHFRERRERVEEALRIERQARYSEFIGLADALLIDLERAWSSLRHEIYDLGFTDQLLEDPNIASAPESHAHWKQHRAETVRLLEEAMAANDQREWRRQADAVRASRVTLELIGSPAVGQQAIGITDALNELTYALSSPDRVGSAAEVIANIRGARQLLLEQAKHDVQLTRGT